MQQATAPSHSPEGPSSLEDTGGLPILTRQLQRLTRQGHLGVVPMWSAAGFLPCCPSFYTEARLCLSAAVLRSTTLASQPGHSPQPAAGQ